MFAPQCPSRQSPLTDTEMTRQKQHLSYNNTAKITPLKKDVFFAPLQWLATVHACCGVAQCL